MKRAGMMAVVVLAVIALTAGQASAGGRGGGGMGGGGGVGGGGAQRGGGQQGSGARGFSEVRTGTGSSPSRPAGSVDRPPVGPERWQYQRAEEITLSGVVADEPVQSKGAGLEDAITVKLENGETRRVALGPPWYRDELGLDLKAGDAVEVIGAPHATNKGAVLARELTWSGSSYVFRTDEGVPVWAGADRSDFGRYAAGWTGAESEGISGEVAGIEGVMPGQRDMGTGIVVRLKGQEAGKERRVHLGPYWYVEKSLPGLRSGQQITVKGSRAQWKGEEVMLASEVERNAERARMRTEQGRPAWAGGWQNWDGWGPGSAYGKLYDRGRVRTVDGWVERVDVGAPMSDMGEGLMATIRTTQQQRVRAHVGPSWFVEQANLSLKPGDMVKLEGSLVPVNGKLALMVSDFTSGKRHVRLRNEDGTPVWSGRIAKPTGK
ncbi:MAG: hypothetical protein ABSD48_18450 [Armatimonadota bacterium]